MIVEEVPPAGVAHPGGGHRRVDDVGEEPCGQDAVDVLVRSLDCAGEKPPNFLRGRRPVTGPDVMIDPFQLDELGADDALGVVAAMSGADQLVVTTVEDEGGGPHERQHRAHVDMGVGLHQQPKGTGRQRQALEAGAQFTGDGIAGARGHAERAQNSRPPGLGGGIEPRRHRFPGQGVGEIGLRHEAHQASSTIRVSSRSKMTASAVTTPDATGASGR
ncbi:MAG TPA: hypothetical protein VMF60_03500 [Acidimicrobiales bacterium]|nr:hypothetical protein [Acidimicrobiales bacterium]